MVKAAIAPIVEQTDDVMIEIQENLNTLVAEKEAEMEDLVIGEPEEFTLTPEIIKEVLTQSAIPDATVMQIQDHFAEEFQDAPPVVKNLVDEKAIEKNNQAKKEQKLLEEVATLKKELQTKSSESVPAPSPEMSDEDDATEYSDVFLRMNPDKAEQITSQTIDGQKYLMIPMEEDEEINLNGVKTTV
mgnify:FL=1